MLLKTKINTSQDNTPVILSEYESASPAKAEIEVNIRIDL